MGDCGSKPTPPPPSEYARLLHLAGTKNEKPPGKEKPRPTSVQGVKTKAPLNPFNHLPSKPSTPPDIQVEAEESKSRCNMEEGNLTDTRSQHPLVGQHGLRGGSQLGVAGEQDGEKLPQRGGERVAANTVLGVERVLKRDSSSTSSTGTCNPEVLMTAEVLADIYGTLKEVDTLIDIMRPATVQRECEEGMLELSWGSFSATLNIPPSAPPPGNLMEIGTGLADIYGTLKEVDGLMDIRSPSSATISTPLNTPPSVPSNLMEIGTGMESGVECRYPGREWEPRNDEVLKTPVEKLTEVGWKEEEIKEVTVYKPEPLLYK